MSDAMQGRGNVAPVQKTADTLDLIEGAFHPRRGIPSRVASSERERSLWALGLGRGVILQTSRTNLPPVEVSSYLSHPFTGSTLDARRFAAVRASLEPGSCPLGVDRSSREGAWQARWDHWGQRGAGDALTVWPDSDIPVLRME